MGGAVVDSGSRRAGRIPRKPSCTRPSSLLGSAHRSSGYQLYSSNLTSGFQIRPSGPATNKVPCPDHLVTSGPSPSSTALQPFCRRRPVSLPDTQPERPVTSDFPPPSGQGPALPRGSSYTALVPRVAATPIQGSAPPPGPAPAPWRASETTVAPFPCRHHLPRGPALSAELPCTGR